MPTKTIPETPVLWIGPARFLKDELGAHIECPFCSGRHFHVIPRATVDAAELTGDFGVFPAPCQRGSRKTYRLLFTDATVDRIQGYCD